MENSCIGPNHTIRDDFLDMGIYNSIGNKWAPGTNFYAWMIATPSMADYQFSRFYIGEKPIHIFTVIPITQKELLIAMKFSSLRLFMLFKLFGVTDIIERDRKDVVDLYASILSKGEDESPDTMFEKIYYSSVPLIKDAKLLTEKGQKLNAKKKYLQACYRIIDALSFDTDKANEPIIFDEIHGYLAKYESIKL